MNKRDMDYLVQWALDKGYTVRNLKPRPPLGKKAKKRAAKQRRMLRYLAG